jgi:hypothetical protein
VGFEVGRAGVTFVVDRPGVTFGVDRVGEGVVEGGAARGEGDAGGVSAGLGPEVSVAREAAW